MGNTKVLTKNGKVLKSGSTFVGVSGGDEYAWCGGKNPKLINQYDYQINIGSDTTFKEKTISTTAQSILASTQITGATLSLGNLSTHDYIIVADYIIPIKYTEELSVVRPTKYAYRTLYFAGRRFNGTSSTLNYNLVTSMSLNTLEYITSAGATTRTSTTYGVYLSASTSPTLSSTSSASAYISKLYTPTITVRANSSYADASCFASMDVDNMNVICRWQVYEIDGKSIASYMYNDLGNICSTGQFPELSIPNAEISISTNSIDYEIEGEE